MIKRFMALLLMLMLFLPALAEEETVPLGEKTLQVHQLNLGFADGYFIRLGDIDILIDGGNAEPEHPTDDVVNYLRAVGVEKLDAYIITHWHLDHCMNINIVLAEFGSEETVVYGPSEKVYSAHAPLTTGEYRQMKTGDVIPWGDMNFHCVGPQKVENNGYRNQDSLNFVLEYGQRRILFTGDFAASGNINNEYSDICSRVDVLKFPHHGMEPYEIGTMASRTVSPQYVIVPGVASKHKIWNFFDNNGVKFPRENVYTVADAPFVILTDGEALSFVTKIDPADYAPQ